MYIDIRRLYLKSYYYKTSKWLYEIIDDIQSMHIKIAYLKKMHI